MLTVGTAGLPAEARIDQWLQQNTLAAGRCRRILDDLRARESADYTMLSVALREIRGLRQPAAATKAAGDGHHRVAPDGNAQERPAPPAVQMESGPVPGQMAAQQQQKV